MTVADATPVERNWVDALSGEGVEREEALEDLHDLLLRAARFELGRRGAALSLPLPCCLPGFEIDPD